MNKQADNSKEKELLNDIEELIDGKDANQKYSNSFLGFCARLLSVRPKTDTDFQLSLKQDLLRKHSAHLEKEVKSCRVNIIDKLSRKISELITVTRKEFITMSIVKRSALGSIPVLVTLLVLVFTFVINPMSQIAQAEEIIKYDPQVTAIIEKYDLKVQEIKVEDNIAFIFLETKDEYDDLEVAITVDLITGTVGKIVAKDGEVVKDIVDIDAYEDKHETFKAEAEAKGMTIEEYKALWKKKKYGKKAKPTIEDYQKKADAMGITIEELKAYIEEQKIVKFEKKAESLGMTVEELKAEICAKKKADYKK